VKLENSFVVSADADRVWNYLLDVERVAPCMPGAEITETIDERTWKGRVSVKLGPVSMAFAGTLNMDEVDEENRRVVLKGQGTEARGRGNVSATITSTVSPASEGTSVEVVTDLTISGAAARFGRGMIGDISERFTQEFAECLSRNLTADEGTAGGTGQQARGEARGEGEGGAEGGGPTPGGEGAVGTSTPSGAQRGGEEAGRPPAGSKAKPISGFRLGIWAMWRAVGRFFGGLFGGGTGEKPRD